MGIHEPRGTGREQGSCVRDERRVTLSGVVASGFASTDPAHPGKARGRNATPHFYQHYEIAIGGWKATIVKTLDYRDGSIRFSTQPHLPAETDPSG